MGNFFQSSSIINALERYYQMTIIILPIFYFRHRLYRHLGLLYTMRKYGQILQSKLKKKINN